MCPNDGDTWTGDQKSFCSEESVKKFSSYMELNNYNILRYENSHS